MEHSIPSASMTLNSITEWEITVNGMTLHEITNKITRLYIEDVDLVNIKSHQFHYFMIEFKFLKCPLVVVHITAKKDGREKQVFNWQRNIKAGKKYIFFLNMQRL